MLKLIFCILLFYVSKAAQGTCYCSQASITLQTTRAMSALTCTMDVGDDFQITPYLPNGLMYSVSSSTGSTVRTVTISGTPTAAASKRVYILGNSNCNTNLEISVYGTPTHCSYGMDKIKLFSRVESEPIPIVCDAPIDNFFVYPSLPQGLSLNTQTGTISGTLTEALTSDATYTVTAINTYGSTSTTFVITSSGMNTPYLSGITGCFWSERRLCSIPDDQYYYQTSADLCKSFSSMYFSKDYGDAWNGLDDLFYGPFSALFYGYISIDTAGEYKFSLSANSGASVYIDAATLPSLSVIDCTSTASTQYASKSMTLTAGYHLIQIRFTSSGTQPLLRLQMGSTSLGIPIVTLTSDYMLHSNRGPSFLEYDEIIGVKNQPLSVVRPKIRSGVATFSISYLPEGLKFDSESGIISGTPKTQGTFTATVTASSLIGETSTTVSIVVLSSLLTGFQAEYYSIRDDQPCQHNIFKGGLVDRCMQQVDSNIDHPISSLTNYWFDALQKCSTKFYAQWQGFVQLNSAGAWHFRLTCSSACRLIGQDDHVIASRWNVNGNCVGQGSVEGVLAAESAGLYYVRVEYMHESGDAGIQLEYRSPQGTMQVVPADKTFHIPNAAFDYETQFTHYFTNSAILSNSPITTVSRPVVFSITPSLPAGLSLDGSTGAISGTPTAASGLTFYTITAATNQVTRTTVIAFDVTAVSIPSGVTLVQGGVTLSSTSEIQLIALRQMTSIQVVGNQLTTFSVSPSLPDGIEIDETGVISGIPKVSSSLTQYTITAGNVAGSVQLILRLTVSGCHGVEDGVSFTNQFYAVTSTGAASVYIHRGSSAILCGANSMGTDGAAEMTSCSATIAAGDKAVFCIPPNASNRVHFTCLDPAGCLWQVEREDGERAPSNWLFDEGTSAPFNADIAFPTFSAMTSMSLSSSSVTAMNGFPISKVTIQPNGSYNKLTISPDIGNGASLSQAGTLTGTLYGYGTQKYTITAVSTSSSATTELTVTFSECSAENGMEAVSFEKTVAIANVESFQVYSQNELIMAQGPFAYPGRFVSSLCLARGTYQIKLLSTGGGWNPSANLRVHSGDGSLIGSYEMPSGTSKEVQLIVSVPEVESVIWKYRTSSPPSSWNSAGFDAQSWQSTNGGNLGSWSGSAFYCITSFDVDDVSLIPVVEFGMYFKDGVIAYLNGVEVFRRNIGSSSVSHSTLASESFETYSMHVGSAQGSLLVKGTNVLAVEVHRAESTTGSMMWYGYVATKSGSCVSRIRDGFVTESWWGNKAGSTAESAWDSNADTEWIEMGLPASTVYHFNYGRTEWINMARIGSSLQAEELDASKVNIYGSDDGDSWDTLGSFTNSKMFSDRAQVKELVLINHSRGYSQYKVEIAATRGNLGVVGVTALDLLMCKLSFCAKDGDWPGTQAGETVTMDCASGYIGERIRTCESGSSQPFWGQANEQECRSLTPPKKYSYIDLGYVISQVTEQEMIMSGMTEMQMAMSSLSNLGTDVVSVWKAKDVTDTFVSTTMGSDVKTAVYIRLTVPESDSYDVFSKVSASSSSLLFYLQLQNEVQYKKSSIDFYFLPILSTRSSISWSTVVLFTCMIIIFVLLILVVGFYLWVRTKSRSKKDGAKRLSSNNSHKV